MPGSSFTAARGQMMRVTKVSSLGRVEYGPAAQVSTNGFVSVNMAPQVTEGEQIRSTNAAGVDCLNERSPDTLDYVTVTMNFCRVDMALFHLINNQILLLKNAFGETAGFDESYNISQVGGFALEVWADARNVQVADPRATGVWLYWLLPFNQGATIGEETIENSAATFTLTGRTKRGNAWGRGPYDVEVVDPVTGAIGPLLVPIAPDKFRRRLLVTVPPPPALEGAQPVSLPSAPLVTVTEAYGDPDRRTVQVIPPAVGGPWRINYGDGTLDISLAADGTTYQYADTSPSGLPRDYTVAVWPTADTTQVRYTRVTVPFTGAPAVNAPSVTITEDVSDPDGMTVSVLVNNHGNGSATVNWGDSTPDSTNPGDGATPNTHAYTNEGIKTLTVTDVTDGTLTTTRQVAVPFDGGSALAASVAESSPAGPNRRTVTLTWDNQNQGGVTVNFGDNTANQNGATTGTTDHVYASNGTYNVTVTDASNPDRSIQVPVTVPFTT
jgi:hypothetical protein